MNEADLQFFSNSALNYFSEVTGCDAAAGAPFLKGGEPIVQEYSGIIGISGERKGCIYITASADMLKQVCHSIIGLKDVDSETIKDLIGEVANTISGNVRQAFGSDFMISVPVVIEGAGHHIKLPEEIPAYVVPLTWQGYESSLVVCME